MRQFPQLTQPPLPPFTFPLLPLLGLSLSFPRSLHGNSSCNMKRFLVLPMLLLAFLHFTFYIGKIVFKMQKNPLNYSKHKQAMIYGTATNGILAACNRNMAQSEYQVKAI